MKIACLTLSSIFFVVLPTFAADTAKPNVLVIVADDLGWAWVVLGDALKIHMDGFAREDVPLAAACPSRQIRHSGSSLHVRV